MIFAYNRYLATDMQLFIAARCCCQLLTALATAAALETPP
jgi:hypothetical protein